MYLVWNTDEYLFAAVPVIGLTLVFENFTAEVHQENLTGRILGISINQVGQISWVPMFVWPANVCYKHSVYQGTLSIAFECPLGRKIIVGQNPVNGRLTHLRATDGSLPIEIECHSRLQ